MTSLGDHNSQSINTSISDYEFILLTVESHLIDGSHADTHHITQREVVPLLQRHQQHPRVCSQPYSIIRLSIGPLLPTIACYEI